MNMNNAELFDSTLKLLENLMDIVTKYPIKTMVLRSQDIEKINGIILTLECYNMGDLAYKIALVKNNLLMGQTNSAVVRLKQIAASLKG